MMEATTATTKIGEYLTPANIDPLVAAGKIGPQDNLGWRNVRWTQLSIARHYGGTRVNDVYYEYIPETDELVRGDIAKMIRAAWKKKRKAREPEQGDLLKPKRVSRAKRPKHAVDGEDA